jgi:hypothetical protein
MRLKLTPRIPLFYLLLLFSCCRFLLVRRRNLTASLDIHTMDKGSCMLKMDGFEVPGVFYFRPDAPIVLTNNSHECR